MATRLKESLSYSEILSAAKKLTAQEKRMLRLQLFSADVLKEAKAFDRLLKKTKPLVKKSDKEIVALSTSIRSKNYAKAKKMLY